MDLPIAGRQEQPGGLSAATGAGVGRLSSSSMLETLGKLPNLSLLFWCHSLAILSFHQYQHL